VAHQSVVRQPSAAPTQSTSRTSWAIWQRSGDGGYWACCERCEAELAFADEFQQQDWDATLHAGFVEEPEGTGVYRLSKRAKAEWQRVAQRPDTSWRAWMPGSRHGRTGLLQVHLAVELKTVWLHCGRCSLTQVLAPIKDDAPMFSLAELQGHETPWGGPHSYPFIRKALGLDPL
jgi:hypothetical protein